MHFISLFPVFKDNPFVPDLSDNPGSYEGQLMGYSLKASGNVVMVSLDLPYIDPRLSEPSF